MMWVGGKGRELYLNNNKIREEKNKHEINKQKISLDEDKINKTY